jgi:hypothetical protein
MRFPLQEPPRVPRLEAPRLLRRRKTIAAKQQATARVGIARCRRNLEDRQLLPSPLAQLALRFGAAGQFLPERIQDGGTGFVFLFSTGHF